jgi:TMEM175 potassium channel family protein
MRSRPQNDQVRSRSENVATRRLEAFSNAVFAIAITLLALDLRVPELTPVTPGVLAAELAAQWPTYLSFLLSFMTLLIAWVYHHRLLELAKHAGTGLLFANGVLLLIVSSLPFPTALLGAYLTTPAASVVCAFYAGYIGVLNFTYNLLWWVVVRQQRTEHREGWRPPTSMILSYLGFPCYVAAAGIAFWSPAATRGEDRT